MKSKTNHFATIFKNGKKLATRRVWVYKSDYTTYDRYHEPTEYVIFKNQLWNVDNLIKEGYKVFYQYIPSNFGSFGLLDCALSNPYERTCRK